jgi:predicted RNA-binding protein
MGDREIARDVIWLEPSEDGARFATFFEGPTTVQARIQRIDFLKHRVILEPLEGNNERS